MALGKVTDAAIAIIVLIVAIYFFAKIGITWPVFWHDLHTFIYGKSSGSGTGNTTASAIMLSRRTRQIRRTEESLLRRWKRSLDSIRRMIRH